jgi:geranylgeranyl diphosphate synthase type II
MTLVELLNLINSGIASLKLKEQPAGLFEPISYTLENGGKRMRPLLTLLGCQMFGGDARKALNPAIGLELFHNFTLLHDEIMDNSHVRRGLETVHVKWNSNTAILSGDAMLSLALNFIIKIDDHHLRMVLEEFNKVVLEVCEGQQYDMNFESTDSVSMAEYTEMIRLKTAVLPASCLKIGAMVANASNTDLENIYKFGENIGLAFQLKDDLLDTFGKQAKFGKKTGGDILANKKTWLFVRAMEMASEHQKQKLLGAYSGKPYDPEKKIEEVRAIFQQLDLEKLGHLQMKEFYATANEHLAAINVSEELKRNLKHLANELMQRDL